MSNKKIQLYARQRAFGALDVLVLAGLMGMAAINAYVWLDFSDKRERDAIRLAHIESLEQALTYFYQEKGHFPDERDGLSGQGEILGSGSALDKVLSPYFVQSGLPTDPLFHLGQTVYGPNDHYYAYDPAFAGCAPVLSINNFETFEAAEAVLAQGGREVYTDADVHIATADYNKCLQP